MPVVHASDYLLAIDPGPKISSFVRWDGRRVIEAGTAKNTDVIKLRAPHVVIEMIEGRGNAVSATTFDTCVWIGRFMQAMGTHNRMYRRYVKLHVCGNTRAKDGNIRQALIDRLGPPGTKRKPGVTYGVTGGEWQALALAATWWDQVIEDADRL